MKALKEALFSKKNIKNNRDQFIEEVQDAMDNAIANKSIDAWFFNDADIDRKEKAAAEKYISSFLPGKWEFIKITGNGTSFGVGWFKNKENNITISLTCYDEEGDYIDDYKIEKYL